MHWSIACILSDSSSLLQRPEFCTAPGLQFRWAEPEETGGRRVGVYRLDMFPPAGTAEEAAQTQVPSLACVRSSKDHEDLLGREP